MRHRIQNFRLEEPAKAQHMRPRDSMVAGARVGKQTGLEDY